MHYYFIVIFSCIILSLILCIIALAFEVKGEKEKGKKSVLGALITLISTIIVGLTLDIPAPEIYTTNGQSKENNEVVIETEWPLRIFYTTEPYGDPQKSRRKYEGSIPIIKSMSISAKSSFLGLKWSKLESRDFVIGNGGEIETIETNEPGTSIEKIIASLDLKENTLFPGDEIKKENLKVDGITIAGETVPILDYEFRPNLIAEGDNKIIVTYKNLKCQIPYTSHKPKISKIKAKYIGDKIKEGDEIFIDQFDVIGIYEDGSEEKLSDCKLEPTIAENAGSLKVKISKKSVSTEVIVNVKEKPALFSNCFETHEPDNVANTVVCIGWDGEKHTDLRGESYDNTEGIYLSFQNTFNFFGSSLTNPITSEIHMVINPKCKERELVSGDIVVENEFSGTTATADVKILVDGEVKWKSPQTITGNMVKPMHFEVDSAGANDEVIIRIKCIPDGDGIGLGIVNISGWNTLK